MNNNKMIQSDRRRVLLGMGAVAVWHKPIVNSVVLPAHAQTSLCAMISIANVVTGPESGLNPPRCNLVFDILSSDPSATLTIVSVTTSTLDVDSEVDVALLGEATSITGPRVTWRGPATTAPTCDAFDPITDVTFSITATCAAAGQETFTQDFLLSDILV